MIQLKIILHNQAFGFEETTLTVQRYFAWHELLLCPHCHKVWAEIIPEGCEAKWPKLVNCERCERGSDDLFTSGSLINDHFCNMWTNKVILNALSKPLLEREFNLAIKEVL